MRFRFFYAALFAGVVLSLCATVSQSMPFIGDSKDVDDFGCSCVCDGCCCDEAGKDGPGVSFVEFAKWDVDRNPTTDLVIGVSANVTYSFVTSDSVRQINTNSSVIPIADALPPLSENAIREAFAAWSDEANITFTEVPDSGLDHFEDLDAGRPESGADIRVGAFPLDGIGSTRARANVRTVVSGNLREFRGAVITLDSDENWAINALDGNRRTIDVFNVAAHEIGHALGLNHSTNAPALMNTGSAATESFRGPQADDIAGAQFLYGEPVTAILLGDVNLDGEVNFFDISPFITLLSSGGLQAEADVDESGAVDFLDISPFIAILSGG